MCVFCSEIRFGNIKRILYLNETFPTMYDILPVVFIQENQLRYGHYILGFPHGILSTPSLTDMTQLETIAGSLEYEGYLEGMGTEAIFSNITSMVQTALGYIVADSNNHCLRIIAHISYALNEKWRSTPYAGECESEGTIDGRRLSAQFNLPQDMIEKNEVIYITDKLNRRIRRLDMKTSFVSTIHESENHELHSITFGMAENEFFVTANHGVLHITGRKEAWLVGCAKEQFKYERTQFSGAAFAEPQAITHLDDRTLIIANFWGDTIKVVDMYLQEVRTLCSGLSVFAKYSI